MVNRIINGLNRQMIRLLLRIKKVRFESVPTFFGSWPDINNQGFISLGVDCTFRSFRIRHHIAVYEDAELIIGECAFFNDGLNLCATMSIKIGHHVKIGDMTYIYDSDFHHVSSGQQVKRLPVSIGNNVWICANTMILPGSVIGDHSVIAAGSIVTGEIPPRCMAAGSPAKPVRNLNIPDGWLRT